MPLSTSLIVFGAFLLVGALAVGIAALAIATNDSSKLDKIEEEAEEGTTRLELPAYHAISKGDVIRPSYVEGRMQWVRDLPPVPFSTQGVGTETDHGSTAVLGGRVVVVPTHDFLFAFVNDGLNVTVAGPAFAVPAIYASTPRSCVPVDDGENGDFLLVGSSNDVAGSLALGVFRADATTGAITEVHAATTVAPSLGYIGNVGSIMGVQMSRNHFAWLVDDISDGNGLRLFACRYAGGGLIAGASVVTDVGFNAGTWKVGHLHALDAENVAIGAVQPITNVQTSTVGPIFEGGPAAVLAGPTKVFSTSSAAGQPLGFIQVGSETGYISFGNRAAWIANVTFGAGGSSITLNEAFTIPWGYYSVLTPISVQMSPNETIVVNRSTSNGVAPVLLSFRDSVRNYTLVESKLGLAPEGDPYAAVKVSDTCFFYAFEMDSSGADTQAVICDLSAPYPMSQAVATSAAESGDRKVYFTRNTETYVKLDESQPFFLTSNFNGARIARMYLDDHQELLFAAEAPALTASQVIPTP